jgi:diadenosine tetraphosphatase ApaH/serine/threonine PP2A family protein phosphatase
MRVAVLSDVHANAVALEAVLSALEPIDAVWVLGDSVGYGPHPDAVVERLTASHAVAVQGNHDAATARLIPTADFNSMARAAVEWTAAHIRPATLAWLAGLPERRTEGHFTLVHGSPRDPLWEYLYSIPAARRSFAAFDTRHCLVGHTHHQLVFREDDGHIEVLSPSHGSRLTLDERRCILNPGSVGQPRDGDARAGAMVVDTETLEVEWFRVPYEVARTQAALRDLPLPAGLADRLALGV